MLEGMRCAAQLEPKTELVSAPKKQPIVSAIIEQDGSICSIAHLRERPGTAATPCTGLINGTEPYSQRGDDPTGVDQMSLELDRGNLGAALRRAMPSLPTDLR